jgi:hypothetical protein
VNLKPADAGIVEVASTTAASAASVILMVIGGSFR